jgi:1,4-dihydroxy-2-naphthoate octaprenyltransferase
MKFIKYDQMFQVFITGMMYVLGSGIAHYLGAEFKILQFLLGITWVMCIQIAGYILMIYFKPTGNLADEANLLQLFKNKPKLLLPIVSLFFITAAVVVVILLINQQFTINLGIILMMIVLGLVFYVMPPFMLAFNGYREVFLAIFQGGFVPILGFLVQSNVYHRLLLLITFPITLIALATHLAMSFSTYAADLNLEQKTFLRLFSWQRTIILHHVLLITAYAFFALGLIQGIPTALLGPALLTMPIAGLQIFWLHRISQGGKTIWPFFRVLAASVFGLSAYLLAFTFWTH